MNPFDEELREALQRRQPPAGFAERVLARIPGAAPQRQKPSFRWQWLAAAAAAVLILTVGLAFYRQHLRRIEGEKAKDQVMLALRVTGSKLRGVQERVVAVQQRTIILPPDNN